MTGKYWVGYAKITGHAFATYVIGEFHADYLNEVELSHVIRVIESPNEKGMGVNFLSDNFFTTSARVKVQKDDFLMRKILDPQEDAKAIKQIEDTFSRIRIQKSGLLAADATRFDPK